MVSRLYIFRRYLVLVFCAFPHPLPPSISAPLVHLSYDLSVHSHHTAAYYSLSAFLGRIVHTRGFRVAPLSTSSSFARLCFVITIIYPLHYDNYVIAILPISFEIFISTFRSTPGSDRF
ncbi:hypothetical protein B0T24DRAFT_638401 [Lasiosphaeria ovina]|uniref:Uncharacterized protein n=1 Tax=Lasiosphaeria ovina TaxID=92902 RepID=A0AAE0JYA8_9PEZI|nr:hypothetical protein B0T24DRAFT_638401 [Lasiosphaeria ovina]